MLTRERVVVGRVDTNLGLVLHTWIQAHHETMGEQSCIPAHLTALCSKGSWPDYDPESTFRTS